MSRPLGFIEDWQPQPKTLALIDQVQGVLVEYRQFGALTCRQIFYRLVAAHAYPKTEAAYERLCETLQRARRGHLISFAAIRDDGDTVFEPTGDDSLADFMSGMGNQIQDFRLRADIGQPYRIIVLSEAAGMANMLLNFVGDFGAGVRSSGGFGSATSKYWLAADIEEHFQAEDRPTVILHLGDFDPSGEHIYTNLRDDVLAFLSDLASEEPEDIALFERIAVTPEQIRAYGLPTAPAKKTDRRSFDGLDGDGQSTVQCEALPPNVLSQIVVSAIRTYWDEEASVALRARETAERRQLREWWNSCPLVNGNEDG